MVAASTTMKFINNNASKTSSKQAASKQASNKETSPKQEPAKAFKCKFTPTEAAKELDKQLLEYWLLDNQDTQSINQLSEQICATAQHSDDRRAVIKSLSGGISFAITQAPRQRYAAFTLALRCCLVDTLSALLEPYFMQWCRVALEECASDKVAHLRLVSCQFVDHVCEHVIHPFQVSLYFGMIYDTLVKTRKWQIRVAGLLALRGLCKRGSRILISLHLEDMLPFVADCMADFKPQVKDEAYLTMVGILWITFD